MTEELQQVEEIITEYYTGGYSKERLTEMRRELSGLNHFLTTYRIEAHKDWTAYFNQLMGKGNSANKAKPLADQEHPELYQLRYLMDSIDKILISIRHELNDYE